MNQFALHFFGKPTVIYNQQCIHFPTRKALALFVYLVVEEVAQSREKLVSLLWPNSDVKSGRASLRNELARLRRTLSVVGPIIVAQEGVVSFKAPPSCTLDLQFVQAAMAQLENKIKPIKTAVWQRALDIYKAPFLATFSLSNTPNFDDWLMMKQEQYHAQVSLLFEQMAQSQMAQRQTTAAVATAIRWRNHDNLNEKAARCLMQAYCLDGNRLAALQVYDVYQLRLMTKLGVHPAPETVQLANMIRNGGQWLQQFSDRRSLVHIKDVVPLVGRASEYGQLVEAYQAVCDGHTQVVVVSGKMGIGKTHLIQDFLNWIVVQGGDVLMGQTHEVGERLPYEPFIDALRVRLHQENAPDDLLDDTWLVELAQLLPELHDRYPDLPDVFDRGAFTQSLTQTRLFEAIFRLGEAFSRRKTVVWFIDDWQWADGNSLDLMHYLGRHWAQHKTPLLLLLAIRSEALPPQALLAQWLADWERHIPVTILPLASLTLADTEYLVSLWANVVVDSAVVRAFSERLFIETAGQPFFIVETLKLLSETTPFTVQGSVDFSKLMAMADPLPLPPNVRKVILTQLGRLDETAAMLLTAASILKRGFCFGELCQLTDVVEQEGLLALDALLMSQLLIETDIEERRYMFSHAQVRDVVYAEAGHARRHFYQQRAFTLLKEAIEPFSSS